MKKVVLAAVVALLSFTAQPASATECTPKGCTGGCRITGGAIDVDPSTGTIVLEEPIECYS